jgi:hypothetical protein
MKRTFGTVLSLLLVLLGGGYEAGLRMLEAGDARAIEDALVFSEVKPYFFRSQFIRTKLIRLLKKVHLSPRQAERFQTFLDSDRKHKKVGKTYA